MPAISCIVFDLDDTLYLEKDYVESGFRAVDKSVLAIFRKAGFGQIAWQLFNEGYRGDIFDRALALLNIEPTPAQISTLVSIYRSHPPSISLAPDAQMCLEELTRKHNVGLITDGPLHSQQKKIEALRLSKWIPCRVLTDRWGAKYHKPHPRSFEMVSKHFNADPCQCLYVADNPLKDFVAPKQLGWRTARILRPGGLYTSLPSGPWAADHQWADLAGLRDLSF